MYYEVNDIPTPSAVVHRKFEEQPLASAKTGFDSYSQRKVEEHNQYLHYKCTDRIRNSLFQM